MREVGHFGIKVALVEPGFFATVVLGQRAALRDGLGPVRRARGGVERRHRPACRGGAEVGPGPEAVAHRRSRTSSSPTPRVPEPGRRRRRDGARRPCPDGRRDVRGDHASDARARLVTAGDLRDPATRRSRSTPIPTIRRSPPAGRWRAGPPRAPRCGCSSRPAATRARVIPTVDPEELAELRLGETATIRRAARARRATATCQHGDGDLEDDRQLREEICRVVRELRARRRPLPGPDRGVLR